jgi:hypothetical protein
MAVLLISERITYEVTGKCDGWVRVPVSHPTRITDSDGRSFEFDHAWAENFTRLTCDGQRGLAHFECVVIQESQEWTANPGRRIS